MSQSYKSWHINNQATTILSWLNAAKRFRFVYTCIIYIVYIILVLYNFRCCPVYATGESTALTKILNGVDVIVTTPPSLLRLINKDLLTLNHVKHIVRTYIQYYNVFGVIFVLTNVLWPGILSNLIEVHLYLFKSEF